MFLGEKIKYINNKLKNSPLAHRLATGAFWSIIGNVLGRGLLLVGFMIVARILKKEAYGELSIIRSTIMMFVVFSGVGIGLTAARYIALYRTNDSRKTHEIYLLSQYTSIVFGFLIGVLLYIFAPLIAAKSLQAPALAIDIRYGAIVLFFVSLSSVQNGILQGFEKFKIIAINNIILGGLQLLCIAIGAYYYGVIGAILGMGLSYLLIALVNQYFIHKNIIGYAWEKLSIRSFQQSTLAVLWKFSFPAIMSSILVMPVVWWCKTYIVQLNGFEAAANYDVAEQWSTIILFLPTTLAGIIFPILTNISVDGTARQYRKLVNINIAINTFLTISATVFIILFTSLILKSYGASFTDKRTFILLLISTIPNAIAAVLGNIIASKGKMWSGFILNLVWAIWLIFFVWLFVGKMGLSATGLALAMLIAYTLHAIFSYAYMWSKVVNSDINK